MKSLVSWLMLIILLVALVTWGSGVSRSQGTGSSADGGEEEKSFSPEEAIAEGDALFEKGDYRSALISYVQIRDAGEFEDEWQEPLERRIAACLYYLGQAGLGEVRIQAVNHLKALLGQYPGNQEQNIEVVFMLAKTYQDLGFDYEALQSWERFRKINKAPLLEQETLYKIGFLLNRVRRHRQAVERLGELLKKYPRSPFSNLAMYVMADSFAQVNQEVLARVWFAEAGKFTPDWQALPKEIMFKKARHLSRAKNHDEAINVLLRVVNFFPPDEISNLALELLADNLLGAGRPEEALKIWSLLLGRTLPPRLYSSVAFKMAELGLTHRGLKPPTILAGLDYYQHPLAVFEQALASEVNTERRRDIMIRKAASLLLLGRHGEAFELTGRIFSRWDASPRREEGIQFLKKTLEGLVEDYHRRGLHLELAGFYYLAGEAEISRELFAGAPLEFFMKSFLHLGLYSEAHAVGQRHWETEKDPRVKAVIAIALAGIELKEGRLESAEKLVDGYLKGMKPGTEETELQNLSLMLANAYLRGQDFARASNIYRRLLMRRVDLPAPALVNYAMALQWTDGGQQSADTWRLAIEKLAAQTPLSPVYHEAYWRLGDVLFQLGRYRESEMAYRKSREGKLPPADDLWVLFQLGRIHRGANNQVAAREVWEAMRREAGDDPQWAPLADFLLRGGGAPATQGGQGGRP